MARLTKNSEKRLWVAARHPVNRTLSVCGFEDILTSIDGRNFVVSETAEQRAQVLLNSNPVSRIMAGAKTAGEAIDQARSERF